MVKLCCRAKGFREPYVARMCGCFFFASRQFVSIRGLDRSLPRRRLGGGGSIRGLNLALQTPRLSIPYCCSLVTAVFLRRWD
jgi:hypothetical protein